MLIYTCIENNYAALPEDMPPGHEYICYGDAEAVGPWKVYPSKDYGDPVRTSRYYKILCPFDGPSIYCDATKLKFLNRTFFNLLYSWKILKVRTLRVCSALNLLFAPC